MIYEKDLDESIARYLGEPDPSIITVIKLAACYVVKHELFGKPKPQTEVVYSYAAGPIDLVRKTGVNSEFARVADRMDPEELWPVMDNLMSKLMIVNPRLYNRVMDQLRE